MKISEAGLGLIKIYEGKRNEAYLCPAGIPTIGYGHTGPEVKLGLVWTDEQCEANLKLDCARFERLTGKFVKVHINQDQFDALVSLMYNIGPGAFATSTLLKLLNDGRYHGAGDEFLRWNKSGGKPVKGLTERRKLERRLFLGLSDD